MVFIYGGFQVIFEWFIHSYYVLSMDFLGYVDFSRCSSFACRYDDSTILLFEASHFIIAHIDCFLLFCSLYFYYSIKS